MQKTNDDIKKHYLEYGTFTYPGLYGDILKNDLPNDIKQIGGLVRSSLIHRTTLSSGNTGTNADKRFGDITKVPWWRQPEDDILQTSAAMLAELYRRDGSGFTLERRPQDKLVLTCRYTAILMASILKSKDIPCRVRAGHSPYFDMGDLGEISTDHWINQYWDENDGRWVSIDVDGSLSIKDNLIDPYDLPEGKFDFAADAWVAVRSGNVAEEHFYNAGGVWGLQAVLWSLGYDFHSLMNNEIIYNHGFSYGENENFRNLSEIELGKIDRLAGLMQNLDANFDSLKHIWQTDKEFRLLAGGLL